jgi:hypothetical protein
VEVYVHLFLTEALHYGHFTPTEGNLVPLGTGACVGPGAGLDFFFFFFSHLPLPGMEEVFLGSLSHSLVSVMYSTYSTA